MSKRPGENIHEALTIDWPYKGRKPGTRPGAGHVVVPERISTRDAGGRLNRGAPSAAPA